MKRMPSLALPSIALILTLAQAPGATVLTEFSRSAIDTLGNPVAPLITDVTMGGAPLYEFSTGTFAAGPFISTLAFQFTPAADENNLLLHFLLMSGTADPSGTGTSPFHDSFTVSLFDGTGTMTLLLVDAVGPTTDPFGTAPGPVTIGPPETFPLVHDYLLNADIHTLEGVPLQLFIDIANEDDGQLSKVWLGSMLEIKDYPIPEPRTALLLGLAALLFAFHLQRKNP
ncbi:MAG: PEP-CTERM sorting domain-containing protein [Verrucomicrobia bacterium]|nr:PEP-CTERM sorting domain-containing protein [Verrucomicrobiota bacterium]